MRYKENALLNIRSTSVFRSDFLTHTSKILKLGRPRSFPIRDSRCCRPYYTYWNFIFICSFPFLMPFVCMTCFRNMEFCNIECAGKAITVTISSFDARPLWYTLKCVSIKLRFFFLFFFSVKYGCAQHYFAYV